MKLLDSIKKIFQNLFNTKSQKLIEDENSNYNYNSIASEKNQFEEALKVNLYNEKKTIVKTLICENDGLGFQNYNK